MNPDWKDAPEWARWLAKDSTGEWYWHEFKPKPDESYGEWASAGKTRRVPKLNDDWKQTLQERLE